jgi:drug/metabolite transporter (DMT)-like permease
MPLRVFALVMLAALLHASWNAVVKSAPDKLLTTILVTTAAAGLSAALIPFLTVPKPSSFPYAVASAMFQIIYFLLVGLALWAMTVAPIAVVAALRETSILFAALIAGLVLREPIGPRRVVSACIIAGGAAILRLA